jgi:transcriptional regulator with XRE-family HTH domain
MRKKLDAEMRHFRMAARAKEPTSGLLRAVRQVLDVPIAEVVGRTGISRSVVLELEVSEMKGSISVRSMARMAEALGCKVVYGIVPKGGKTMERLAEERMWAAVLEKQGTGGS